MISRDPLSYRLSHRALQCKFAKKDSLMTFYPGILSFSSTTTSGQALGLVASWLVEKNTNSYVDFYGLVNWLVGILPFY